MTWLDDESSSGILVSWNGSEMSCWNGEGAEKLENDGCVGIGEKSTWEAPSSHVSSTNSVSLVELIGTGGKFPDEGGADVFINGKQNCMAFSK